MPKTIAYRLAEYVASTKYSGIPKESLDSVKRMAIDTLAVAWAGSDAPGIDKVRDFMIADQGCPQSTVWAGGARVTAKTAAFLNSASAAALDFDGVHATSHGSVHADSVVLPAALAVAELCNSNGKDLLLAIAIGNDIATRLCLSSHLPHKGWYYTSIYGIFGATAAAAKLLNLDAQRTCHAFGIALSQVACTQQPNIEHTLGKRYSSAFSSQSGVFAAQLAGSGVTAPEMAFEGKFGFYNLYQNGDDKMLLQNIGDQFPHVNTAIKKYPSCACNHTAIEATLDLVREHDLSPNDIDGIEVTISPYVDRVVGGPFTPGKDPQVSAQFSVRYSVAVAVINRCFGMKEIQSETVLSPQIKALSDKINIRLDYDKPNDRHATVKILRKNSTLLIRRIENIPGTPEMHLNDDEIQEKFHQCAALGVIGLNKYQRNLLLERINSLENISTVKNLFTEILPSP